MINAQLADLGRDQGRTRAHGLVTADSLDADIIIQPDEYIGDYLMLLRAEVRNEK